VTNAKFSERCATDDLFFALVFIFLGAASAWHGRFIGGTILCALASFWFGIRVYHLFWVLPKERKDS
jgi:hypothetical protein